MRNRLVPLPIVGMVLTRKPGHRSFAVVQRADGWHWCACSYTDAYAGRAVTRDAAWASCERILAAMLKRERAASS